MDKNNPTACIIIIGNEILSGRTLDLNTQEIALQLSENGISLVETRVIPDIRQMIIDTVRELHIKYDYVFTTGGIGPTHDDITAEAIAAAFNLKYERNEAIYNILVKHYAKQNEEVNSAREKMAFIPENAGLIHNDATYVPGFITKNVFSMAGIPNIMKAMLKSVIPMLKKGKKIYSKSLEVNIAESKIANMLENLQNKYSDIDMGSYPFYNEKIHGTVLVLRSTNTNLLEKAFIELEENAKNIK